jgi:hypothetical protein
MFEKPQPSPSNVEDVIKGSKKESESPNHEKKSARPVKSQLFPNETLRAFPPHDKDIMDMQSPHVKTVGFFAGSQGKCSFINSERELKEELQCARTRHSTKL